MKVLHVIKTLCAGGAELHLLTLCRALKRQGIEVVVARLVDDVRWGTRLLNSDFEDSGIRLLDLEGSHLAPWRAVARLFGALKMERPDVLHTHLPRGDLLGALVRYGGFSVPWVVSVHDVHARAGSVRFGMSALRAAWCRADALIAISNEVRRWVVDDLGVPPRRVEVIHYGIETEEFSRAESSQRRNGADAVIGSIGRLEERKGHQDLLRAMPMILARAPGARLVIAGNDPWGYGRTLERLGRQLGIGERLQLVGFQKDVRAFLDGVDVFAFASRAEGFGQVVIEAMACGRPVVASRVAPLTEIVVDGATGMLVNSQDSSELASALSDLLLDGEKARAMGDRGRQRVTDMFGAPRMVRETIAMYERVVSRVRGPDGPNGTVALR